MMQDARPARGWLITMEGVEGAGKSTQVGLLAAWLRARGLPVVTTAEPDGTPLGLRLRRVLGETAGIEPLSECLLFGTARAEHVRRILHPALTRGAVVLCDRFTDSTVAYQGYGRGLGLEIVAEVNRVATGGLVPDLTVVLDLDVATGLRRVRGRTAREAEAPGEGGVDPFERLGLEFHERVRKGYCAIRAREPDRVALVDADRAPESVAADIRGLVAQRLGLAP